MSTLNCSHYNDIFKDLLKDKVSLGCFIAVNVLISLIAFTGNLSLLLAVRRTISLQTISNFFIASLSAADLLVGGIYIPASVLIHSLSPKILNHIFLFVFSFSVVQSLTASTLSVCAISIDRLVAIIRPLKYPYIITSKVLHITVGSIWFISFMAVVPSVIIDRQSVWKFWTTFLMLTLILPLSVIVFCYYKITKICKKQLKKTSISFRQRNRYIWAIKSHKAAKTFMIIFISFVVCFSPNAIAAMVYALKHDDCITVSEADTYVWTANIAFINSALNPIIYGIRNRSLRKGMTRQLTRLLVCKG